MKIKILAAFAICIGFESQAQVLPLDPAVRTGRLPNGFTYFIRNNQEPKSRVLFYLVNKIGSVLEDDDQQGLAHFMEHMNFNGTKNFPKNELVNYLQKSGVKFGADLNAYTSFDETIYQLPLPTENSKLVANGLKIMKDWAQGALLDPGEIESERGVVLEEERLGKGADDRMRRKYFPMLFNNARYAKRLPIGKDEILKTFKPAVIRRFFHDWYRPDLQALIVVGDVNVDEMEKNIKAQFSGLTNPADERPRTKYAIPLTGKNQFLAVTDKEFSSTALQIFFKHKAGKIITQADYLAQLRQEIFNQIMNSRRFAETSRENEPSYNSIGFGIQGFLGGLDVFSFDVNAKNGKLKEAVQQGWRVFERARRYGFSPEEFERAKVTYLRNLQQSVNELNKTPSINYVTEYQKFFLNQEAAPGIKWEYDFTKANIGKVKLDEINQLFKEYIKPVDRDILILAAERDRSGLPDEATVNSWIEEVSKEQIKPFKEEKVDTVLMAESPVPGKVVARDSIPALKINILTFNNGIKIVLKPTNFKNDEIRITAFSPGGTSLYNDKDYDNAANAGPLMSRMGIGKYDPVALSKMLNGKLVNVVANVGKRSETIDAVTAPVDLETALQLIYLRMTTIRKDSLIFKNTISTAKDVMTNRYASPANVYSDTINNFLGHYNYRVLPITHERLDKINLERCAEIFKERFADASNFTFFFVGNFDVEKIQPLLAQYLGALPALHRDDKPRDLGIRIPKGQVVKKVFKGKEDKCLINIMISGDFKFAAETNLKLKALSDILQIKLLQDIREKEGEVYSPSVSARYDKYPVNNYAIVISFGCAPKNADHLVETVKKELEELRENGLSQGDINKFKISYEKGVDLALKENAFWTKYLASQFENNEDPSAVLRTPKYESMINPASLKEAAQQYLTEKNMLIFELLPESSQAIP